MDILVLLVGFPFLIIISLIISLIISALSSAHDKRLEEEETERRREEARKAEEEKQRLFNAVPVEMYVVRRGHFVKRVFCTIGTRETTAKSLLTYSNMGCCAVVLIDGRFYSKFIIGSSGNIEERYDRISIDRIDTIKAEEAAIRRSPIRVPNDGLLNVSYETLYNENRVWHGYLNEPAA